MRVLLRLLLTAGLLGATLAAAPVGRGAGETAVCDGSGPISATLLGQGLRPGCSLAGRTVTSGHASVEVPPAGLTVAASGYGAGAALVVSNVGGVVTALTGDPAAGEGAARESGGAGAAAGACRARAYTLAGGGRHPWASEVVWRLRTGSVPGRLGVRRVRDQMRQAMANWTHNDNSCGIGGRPRLHARYGGRTRVGTGFTVSGGTVGCGDYNRTNTVEFGHLPGRQLGWTCYWWGPKGKMVGFDTRIERTDDIVTRLPARCRGRYDLQSVVTHEFGHAIGLGHVGNPNLTMYHYAPACSTAPRTLGRGDVRGLSALYGSTRG